MDLSHLLFVVPLAGLISIIMAGLIARHVLAQDAGDEKMREVAHAIQEGAMAYLSRQYRTIAVVAVLLAVVIWVALGWKVAVSYLIGSIASGVAGFIGMNVSVRANVRTAAAAEKSLKDALNVAFRGGSVTGLSVVGLSLLGVSVTYLVARDVTVVVGFGFGASLISLFARVGGGIYTKAADVGADIVGKIEAGLPEDSPKNPATIADNVGDNVGDCAGMGADLFETYAVTLLAAMLIGSSMVVGSDFGSKEVTYPLLLGSVAIIASIIAVFFVRMGPTFHVMNAMYKGVGVAAGLSAAAFLGVTVGVWGWGGLGYFWATLIGIGVTVLMFVFTQYYTETHHNPVKSVAAASQTGAGTNVITGLAVGMESTVLPTITIVVGILASFFLSGGTISSPMTGLYGIAIAAVSMLSTAGMMVALDSYGPITDNAGGIAEMSGQPERVREITDKLDGVGNTTKAITKGYAIGSAALGSLALFSDYHSRMVEGGRVVQLDITNPIVLVGLFIGALLPFAFTSLTMRAVSKAAMNVVVEVRRQLKAIPGILTGTDTPDYAKCVDIVTKAALREMIIPGCLGVVVPLIVGWVLGTPGMAGVLIGIIVSGLMLAMVLNNAGGAWDNAKKLIETDGLYGGKGSEAHKAAIVGDTVGDPTKDTSGPGLNALIKAVNMVAILTIPLFINGGLIA